MKIKHNTRKKIIITICAIVVLLIGGTVFAYVTHIPPFSKSAKTSSGINYKPATSGQKAAGNQTKQNNMDANGGKAQQNDTPPAPTPIPGSSMKSVGMLITASTQNGSIYQIRAQIDTPTNDGTCTLTLTQGNKTVTKSAGVQALAKISTCEGFDIPTSELASGTWQLTLKYNSDTLTGKTNGTIAVQ